MSNELTKDDLERVQQLLEHLSAEDINLLVRYVLEARRLLVSGLGSLALKSTPAAPDSSLTLDKHGDSAT